jgi:DNA-binding transcriptional ArsR family regulator
MRQIKKGFDLIDYDISKYAAVLVFPVRLAIIRVLINDGDWVPVTALAHLSLDEQFVRQHLEELQKVGLVELLKSQN